MYNKEDQPTEEVDVPERKSNRTKLLVLRLTPEERKAFDAVAQAEGLTASSWIRRIARLALDRRERRAAAGE